jgi:hypothetical protein
MFTMGDVDKNIIKVGNPIDTAADTAVGIMVRR